MKVLNVIKNKVYMNFSLIFVKLNLDIIFLPGYLDSF